MSKKGSDMVAVITGAGSGLGAAITRHFVGEGKTVALLERDEKNFQTLARPWR
jgi:NADP-dependent 3-hydroxy acid dehydrogenase YdfG